MGRAAGETGDITGTGTVSGGRVYDTGGERNPNGPVGVEGDILVRAVDGSSAVIHVSGLAMVLDGALMDGGEVHLSVDGTGWLRKAGERFATGEARVSGQGLGKARISDNIVRVEGQVQLNGQFLLASFGYPGRCD